MRQTVLRNRNGRIVLMSAVTATTMALLMGVLATPAHAQNKVVVIPMTETKVESPSGPPAPVEKTGQTTSYETGDDGDLEKGVASPSPRFTDNGNGTVTDHLTGLIWLQNGNCTEFHSDDNTGVNERLWVEAVSSARKLASGKCGLTDGSKAGDWRLPNRNELESLIDLGHYNPALPDNNYLTNTVASDYWSSTTCSISTGGAWGVGFLYGYVYDFGKQYTHYVRAVRGGQ